MARPIEFSSQQTPWVDSNDTRSSSKMPIHPNISSRNTDLCDAISAFCMWGTLGPLDAFVHFWTSPCKWRLRIWTLVFSSYIFLIWEIPCWCCCIWVESLTWLCQLVDIHVGALTPFLLVSPTRGGEGIKVQLQDCGHTQTHQWATYCWFEDKKLFRYTLQTLHNETITLILWPRILALLGIYSSETPVYQTSETSETLQSFVKINTRLLWLILFPPNVLLSLRSILISTLNNIFQSLCWQYIKISLAWKNAVRDHDLM